MQIFLYVLQHVLCNSLNDRVIKCIRYLDCIEIITIFDWGK